MVSYVTNYPCPFEDVMGEALRNLPSLPPSAWIKEKTLGEALYGKVYLASPAGQACGRLPEAFALKVMPKFKVDSPQPGMGLESAKNELCAAFCIPSLMCSSIAKVLFIAEDEANYYLATEYCSRGELFAVVKRLGRLPCERAIREVLVQILEALKCMHEAGIAHRDISLENVLVMEDGKVRVIDLGQGLLVHPAGYPEQEVMVPVQAHGLPGKKPYRAPEAVHGPYSAKKLDMYQTGVMLYVLVTGAYPVASSPNKDSAVWNQMPSGLLDLTKQLLHPDPSARLSAEEALNHPWVTGTLNFLPPEPVVQDEDWEDGDDIEEIWVKPAGEHY